MVTMRQIAPPHRTRALLRRNPGEVRLCVWFLQRPTAPTAATALRASSRVVNTLVLRPADQMTMVDADERDRPSRGSDAGTIEGCSVSRP
jgi:hypothetical protein